MTEKTIIIEGAQSIGGHGKLYAVRRKGVTDRETGVDSPAAAQREIARLVRDEGANPDDFEIYAY